jgi:hypothetical protein
MKPLPRGASPRPCLRLGLHRAVPVEPRPLVFLLAVVGLWSGWAQAQPPPDDHRGQPPPPPPPLPPPPPPPPGPVPADAASGFSAAQLLEIQALINRTREEMLASGGPVQAQCQGGLAAAEAVAKGVAANAASMDHAWLVLGGALVFFMHSGFALLEVGSVSARNVQNVRAEASAPPV